MPDPNEVEQPLVKKTKDEKRKKKKGKEVVKEPRSITALCEAEKLRLRPHPMQLEALLVGFVAAYDASPRKTEEKIGERIWEALTMGIAAASETAEATTPLAYCRVCDAVCDDADSFYEHIKSKAHLVLKQNDSIPLFDEDDEPLTKNQELAREFMGLALLQLRATDEDDWLGTESPSTTNDEETTAADDEESFFSTEEVEEEIESDEEGEEVTVESFSCRTESSLSAESVQEAEREEPKTPEKLTGPILSSLKPADIVEYRLRKRPCAECSRLWDEYGVLLEGKCKLSTEFAFRSHPLHPCVTLLNIVLECHKGYLVFTYDEAVRPSCARPVKYPSKDQLKELGQELDAAIPVPLMLGHRHSYTCTESFQVSMHGKVDEVRAIYDRFMDGCRKRDTEGRPFFCDICRVSLPSSRHFQLHLLSDAHDKKTWKAPLRQSELWNPLCQMVCFLDMVSLMKRKQQKKVEKKEERKEEKKRVKKEKGEAEEKARAAKEKEEQSKRSEEANENESGDTSGSEEDVMDTTPVAATAVPESATIDRPYLVLVWTRRPGEADQDDPYGRRDERLRRERALESRFASASLENSLGSPQED